MYDIFKELPGIGIMAVALLIITQRFLAHMKEARKDGHDILESYHTDLVRLTENCLTTLEKNVEAITRVSDIIIKCTGPREP